MGVLDVSTWQQVKQSNHTKAIVSQNYFSTRSQVSIEVVCSLGNAIKANTQLKWILGELLVTQSTVRR